MIIGLVIDSIKTVCDVNISDWLDSIYYASGWLKYNLFKPIRESINTALLDSD